MKVETRDTVIKGDLSLRDTTGSRGCQSSNFLKRLCSVIIVICPTQRKGSEKKIS
jgi:hypothetical protein